MTGDDSTSESVILTLYRVLIIFGHQYLLDPILQTFNVGIAKKHLKQTLAVDGETIVTVPYQGRQHTGILSHRMTYELVALRKSWSCLLSYRMFLTSRGWRAGEKRKNYFVPVTKRFLANSPSLSGSEIGKKCRILRIPDAISGKGIVTRRPQVLDSTAFRRMIDVYSAQRGGWR